MPLEPDDEICFCFHVTLRKVASFCRNQKPKVASQISECLSAGTGCGWCRPMLRKLHRQYCPDATPPWWRAIPDAPPPDPSTGADPVTDYHSAERDADAAQLDSEHYAAGRQQYLKDTGRKPPP
ncbi:MAG TPA: (2Fe-2S)-binding protein [Tepidisphaeraceae bacterium]|nr:(2Fe-2S)-binding protein [Tepidisphaeraceae bacterium]